VKPVADRNYPMEEEKISAPFLNMWSRLIPNRLTLNIDLHISYVIMVNGITPDTV
jgi:hypothetical protein